MTPERAHTCPNEPYRHHICFRRHRSLGHRGVCSTGSEARTERTEQGDDLHQSVELAKVNRQFTLELAKEMGGGTVHDYAVYAEMYYWLLLELHDKGKLPENWRTNMKTKFPEF